MALNVTKILRIKKHLPGLIHIATFYDNGTVFESTFEPSVNIPKLGENLSESLKHMEQLFATCQFEKEPYINMIYETNKSIIMFLKVGEQSNLALFFRKGEKQQGEREPDIFTIRRYLSRIDFLMDMDKLDLDKHTVEEQKKELGQLEQILKLKQEAIEKAKIEVANCDLKMNELNEKINPLRQKIEGQIPEKIGQPLEKKEDVQKEMDVCKSNLKEFEFKKTGLLSEINGLLDETKKLKDKIAEKSASIATLEEKIKQIEKVKLEEKFTF